MKVSRRSFIKLSGASALALYVRTAGGRWVKVTEAAIDGGSLAPERVPKYQLPLVKPPAMPGKFQKKKDQYMIAVRQFDQRILPLTDVDGEDLPATTVWSYGSLDAPGPAVNPTTLEITGGSFNYPAFTIEATWSKDTQVIWRNELVDANGNFLPHLLPVDPTLHWANPAGGVAGRDRRPQHTDGIDEFSDPFYSVTPGTQGYTGPVPIVTHVHGAHTHEDSDGYPEAWYLPAANNIPLNYARTGTFFDYFNQKYDHGWEYGDAAFKYPNDQRATTLWYHDHTLGMTRLNVYAGPAGFWLIRGGPDDQVLDVSDPQDPQPGVLPGPAPGVGDHPLGTYYEIPIAIQDRSFNDDGSLFYPNHRAFFEGLDPEDFADDFPFTPEPACDGDMSDVAPIWQPEFFGNMMVVNGFTWPFLNVEQRRYRFRLLNGCNSRFLILDFGDIPGVEVWQIGAEGGFLAAPVNITADHDNKILMSPAERADVIVDFTNVPIGDYILKNLGPDEPFGGGTIGEDFDPADPDSTGQVMQFHVGPILDDSDPTTPPEHLQLPAIEELSGIPNTRYVSLNEEESATVKVLVEEEGEEESWALPVELVCDSPVPFGPTAALLGTINADGTNPAPLLWSDLITENPAPGAVEVWEIHNHTADAHPIHIHLVQFQVLGRETFDGGASIAGSNGPLPTEDGWKDTVISYPGEITRVKMRFDIEGLYVWHCHIVEHEDNEMMRPFHVGPIPPDAPQQ